MKRVISHIDRWGPGVLSIITLCAVVVLAWNYDRQLDAIRLSKDLEIARLNREIEQTQADNRDRENRLRQEYQREITRLSELHEIEIMRSQMLRERLIKKGWIE